MLTCINKNSMEYRALKERSGISDSILEAICRDFLDKYDRFPYLDEIIGSNSDPYLRKVLLLDMYNGTSILNLLSITGTDTVEDANIVLNDLYRDVEVEITPLNKEAIVEITKRPTEDNFDNWTEEDEILAKAPRDEQGNLLAPNGKVSNLTEKQYAQVRTKAFKRWFGDWENSSIKPISFMPKRHWNIGTIIDNPVEAANICDNTQIKVLNHIIKQFGKPNNRGTFYAKPVTIWAKSPINESQIHHSTVAVRINGKVYLYDMPQSEYIRYDSYNKGTIINEYSPRLIEYTAENLKNLYGTSIENLHINDEVILDNDIIDLPLTNASKVVDENGEPLVVYHYTDDENLTKFSTDFDNYFSKTGGTKKAIFFTEDNVEVGSEDNFLTSRKKKLSLFLNIRNLEEHIGTKEDLHKQGTSYREIVNESAKREDNTSGLVFKGFDDNKKENQTIYVVHSSNQIKSASSNSGLFSRTNDNIYDPAPNGYLVMTNALLKLASLYGIRFNEITDAELASDKWKNIISDPSSVNAFVYNGLIYINISRANLDAPIHEMMHLFVGSIRFQNPNLYQHLISLSEQFPNYNKLAREFSRRTRNDINEEIFVLEVSKYLVGLPSNISNIESKLLYEITYNIKRVLDTILMGEDSVKTLSNDRLFNLSLKEIAREIHSSVMTNNFHGTLNVENSALHRKLNNIKSDLQSKGILKEYCD